MTSPTMLLRLSESIADVEYAVKTHEHFKRWFGKWLKLHIVISFVLYVLMGLHIWASIHFGLRWFEPSSTTHFGSMAPSARFVEGTTMNGPGQGASTRSVQEPSREFMRTHQRRIEVDYFDHDWTLNDLALTHNRE